MVTSLIINGLSKVELWVEYGWNYMKFHPNSTTNSTTSNTLILIVITPPWWKSGITNDKKYFSWKRAEKVLTTVKNQQKGLTIHSDDSFFFHLLSIFDVLKQLK